ncbi:MAG: molybdate ABC transporter substrate-binding protein [Candidatus Omnitrophica bacterium]|nr:molybdate ABC transporter substrate-binding protein [Candidatus Omnitrophota bacterium]
MRKIILIAVAVFLALPIAAFAGEIIVAGAANAQFILEDLKAAFAKETGIDVKTIIGSSGALAAQVENGAPFDVFLSADMKYPNALYKDGFSKQAPEVYAYGVLVLWTMKSSDLSQGINVLKDAGVGKIALADPRLAPYGREAVNVLEYYKLYAPLQTKLVFGQSISQVNQFVTTGAADFGFTAKSVVLAPKIKGHGKWIELDPHAYRPIAQGVIVLKYAKLKNHFKEAREFYDFLFSARAREIFKKYGYQLP